MNVNENFSFCEACKYGKLHALPFSNSKPHALVPFDLVHTDLWGPALVLSTEGYRYYVHFIDEYSRFVWVYPLKLKSDTYVAFNHFLLW